MDMSSPRSVDAGPASFEDLFGEDATWRPNSPVRFWFARHGQSEYNLEDRIGGDSSITPTGQRFADALPALFGKILSEQGVDARFITVWTSTLMRTIQTASKVPLPQVHLWELDEVNAGVCDGMTYEDIKCYMPFVHYSRKKQKLFYRYPSGESYVDLCHRVWPVMQKLRSHGGNKLIVAHQAVLRCFFGYLQNQRLSDLTQLSVPHHVIFQFTVHPDGRVEREDFPMEMVTESGAALQWPFPVAHSRPLTAADLRPHDPAHLHPLLNKRPLERHLSTNDLEFAGRQLAQNDLPAEQQPEAAASAVAAAEEEQQRQQPSLQAAASASTLTGLGARAAAAAPIAMPKPLAKPARAAMPGAEVPMETGPYDGASSKGERTASPSPAKTQQCFAAAGLPPRSPVPSVPPLEVMSSDSLRGTVTGEQLSGSASPPTLSAAGPLPSVSTEVMSIPERVRRAITPQRHSRKPSTDSQRRSSKEESRVSEVASCPPTLQCRTSPAPKTTTLRLQLEASCPSCGSLVVVGTSTEASVSHADVSGCAREPRRSSLSEDPHAPRSGIPGCVSSIEVSCDSHDSTDMAQYADIEHEMLYAGSPSNPFNFPDGTPRTGTSALTKQLVNGSVRVADLAPGTAFRTDDPRVNNEAVLRRLEDENGFWFRRDVWISAVEHKQSPADKAVAACDALVSADLPW